MASKIIKKDTLQSGEVRYQVRIKHQSRFIKSKTFKRRSDALQWSSEFISNIENFRNAGRQPCQVTFSRLVREYMRQWRGTDAVRGYAVKRFSEHFGNVIIDKITIDDCRTVMRQWEDKQPATYNKYRSILVAVFDFALLQNEESGETYLTENPAKKIRNKPIDNVRVRFLTDDEKRRLVAACREIGGKFYIAFLLALSTGLRKSNVLNLRWSDVDFNQGLLSVGKTKNGDPIMAPVPAAVLYLLQKYRQIGSGLIFESAVVTGVPADYKKQWIRAREMAGIENFRWHDLRHDAASTLARDGRTLLEIAEILGHRSLQSTKRYSHLSTDHKSRLIDETMTKTLGSLI